MKINLDMKTRIMEVLGDWTSLVPSMFLVAVPVFLLVF